MRLMASDLKRDALRFSAQLKRRLKGLSPRVLYFHQADDPYSHLAVQKLATLKASYDIDWIPYLVSPPDAEYQGDVDRFRNWALTDAKSIAPYYETDLPIEAQTPASDAVNQTNQNLVACLREEDFPEKALEAGQELWSGSLTNESGEKPEAGQALSEGNALRKSKGHYLGAMFYFDGEWYWGLDRMYLLEKRLVADGYGKQLDGALCVPPPRIESATGLYASDITLEYFPSLRSPYTAVGHDRVMGLVKRSGVKLILRPVMPMMMRGVGAPREKQLYIISDSKREAEANEVKFRNFVDPFGEPVIRAFTLYPWIESQGKAEAFVGAYIKAAWAEGVDISSDSGLSKVVESVGLSWQDALKQFHNNEWEQMLETNVQDMLTEGLWGVPSFRVSGGNRQDIFSCWGQDRIWRVEAEITQRSEKGR